MTDRVGVPIGDKLTKVEMFSERDSENNVRSHCTTSIDRFRKESFPKGDQESNTVHA